MDSKIWLFHCFSQKPYKIGNQENKMPGGRNSINLDGVSVQGVFLCKCSVQSDSLNNPHFPQRTSSSLYVNVYLRVRKRAK
jgi:hypothetical protein